MSKRSLYKVLIISIVIIIVLLLSMVVTITIFQEDILGIFLKNKTTTGTSSLVELKELGLSRPPIVLKPMPPIEWSKHNSSILTAYLPSSWRINEIGDCLQGRFSHEGKCVHITNGNQYFIAEMTLATEESKQGGSVIKKEDMLGKHVFNVEDKKCMRDSFIHRSQIDAAVSYEILCFDSMDSKVSDEFTQFGNSKYAFSFEIVSENGELTNDELLLMDEILSHAQLKK